MIVGALSESFDASSILALGTLVVTVIGGVVAYIKVKPEAESIATKTTLEVNESLREERKEAREEARELRKKLRERDEEIMHLQRKITAMREQTTQLQNQIDTLEAEVNAMSDKASKARKELEGQ